MKFDISQIDPITIINDLKKAALRADTEEDFKIDAIQTLRKNIIDRFGLPYGQFEKAIYIEGKRRRADALYGHLFIEFKKPGVLEKKGHFEKAMDQLKKYIYAHGNSEELFSRYFGVVLDGYKIGFLRFVEKGKAWIKQGPYEINSQNILRLLEALSGLYKKPLDADMLIKDFGPESIIAKNTIKTLYEKLKSSKSERTRTLFSDWKRVFSQVCTYSPKKIEGLEKFYGLPQNIDPEALLFTVHTYYALTMKLIAAEVAVLFGEPMMRSYIRSLENAYLKNPQELKSELENLEEGGVFLKIGIVNFLEADYFSWYLNEWDEEVVKIIIEVVKQLSYYEVGTAELEPERIKDLFKRLYQYLVPKKIRHDLGEYYTPDWLAELLLNEINYDGNINIRLLDPSCGSGTFLVLALKRVREYRERHFLDPGEVLDKITKNIVGFDLNPLAVLASRTNYLIAIGDFIRERKEEKIRIPVFLADSILVERKETLYEDIYLLKTVVGKFGIPISLVKRDLLTKILTIIEECVKNQYDQEDLKARIQKEIKEIKEEEMLILSQLFNLLLRLEKEGRNRIWLRILKNSFAPLFEGKFDFVVGNPPWINWENLPENYRKSTKPLWEKYGLTKKTVGMGLGKVKRDVAMLFVARCFDVYTKKNGKLAFLIPFTAYKTQTGAGFRNYLAYYSNITKIHDLVELYPFEGAINRTSLLVIEKGKTEFPIRCVMWSNPISRGVPQEFDIEDVKKSTNQFNMIMIPIKESFPEFPWMLITNEKAYKAVKKVIGESPHYKAYEGINTALNGVYWIDIISKKPGGLVIKNTEASGLKKKVKKLETVLNPDLIYPLIRGRNVKRWFIESYLNYIVLPVDENGETISHHKMKVENPKVYEYFLNFFEELTNRGGEPYKTKLKPYRELSFSKAEEISPPFYWLFNVKPSLAKFKVVWKRIAGGITGKAISFASAVLDPVHYEYLNEIKPIVINDSLILIPFNEEKEAYYVSGILNSSPLLLTIASYTYELRMETHITQYVNIPKFNEKNKLHLKLSFLSKKAHKLAKKVYLKNDRFSFEYLKKIEKEIDKITAILYGINNEELLEIRKSLNILKGEFTEIE